MYLHRCAFCKELGRDHCLGMGGRNIFFAFLPSALMAYEPEHRGGFVRNRSQGIKWDTLSEVPLVLLRFEMFFHDLKKVV